MRLTRRPGFLAACALLGALAAAAPALAAPAATAPDNPLPKVEITQFQLSNGLTVFLVPDHSVPMVAVDINYMVGSKNEKPGRTGFAHLFEHMMFQGSRNSNRNYINTVTEMAGNVNGGTNTDRTRYWEVVPAPYLERALWLEADRMGFLLDALTKERLDNQIAVVQNERRQNYENRPYGLLRERVAAVLYPPHHPYHWITIGSMADLSAATLDDVKDFFRTYYTPNNASLAIVGDFDIAQAKALVEKYFGPIPPGPPVARIAQWVPELPGEVSLEMQDRVELPRTQVIWPSAPVYGADDAALEAFADILGGSKSSRLYKALVYEKQIAQDAVSFQGGTQLAGTFALMLTPKPGHTTDEVERAAFAVLKDALDKGVTQEELDRVKRTRTAAFVHGMESIGGFGGVADRINEYFHYLGKPDLFRWDLQRFLDLTPEQVVAAARRTLGPNRLVARVTPQQKMTAAAAGSLDRSVAPARAADRPFTLPARQRFTLPNGLKVVFVEQHKVPVVSVSLVVKSGSAADPQAKPGLASLTASLLTEGAAGKSAQQVADAFESLGADVNVDASTDYSTVSLDVLGPQFEAALGLFADVVARPDFPTADVDRQKNRRLVDFKRSLDSPDYLASLAARKVLFENHPYGHLPAGTPAGVTAITQDDVRAFWSSHYVPANAELIVVGDLKRADLEAKLAKALASWKGDKAPAVTLNPMTAPAKRAIYLIDKPGAVQSAVSAIQLGAARNTPDYAKLNVLNWAFGGQFTSRLNLNLRESKGFTYGARSAFEYGRVSGGFSAGAPVQANSTAATVREILAELEGITGARPLTAGEIKLAQDGIADGYARRFETTNGIARQLVDPIVYGLPDDSVETYPNAVRSATAADLATVAKTTFRPKDAAIIVVGDAKTVRPDLEKLGIEIIELDREGNRK